MIDYYIQRKYLNLLSPKLKQFKDKGNNLWNCRCPFCGDSKKNEFLCRGYFYVVDGNIIYKCHNCQVGFNLQTAIKMLAPQLYNDLLIEAFRKEPRKLNIDNSKDIETVFKNIKVEQTQYINEEITNYLVNVRKIPETKLDMFEHIECINDFANTFERYKGKSFSKSIAVGIPFFNESGISYYQCRDLGDNPVLKYVTLEINGGHKIFGLNELDKTKCISVLEGPFDSVFVNNAVANAGLSDNSNINYLKSLNSNLRFVYDNDYRYNKTVKNQLLKRIREGFDVVIYDKKFKFKDINEAIQKGWTIDNVNEYLDSRTFNGLLANLELTK